MMFARAVQAEVERLQRELTQTRSEVQRASEARELREQLRADEGRRRRVLQDAQMLQHQLQSLRVAFGNLRRLASEQHAAAVGFQDKVVNEVHQRVNNHVRKAKSKVRECDGCRWCAFCVSQFNGTRCGALFNACDDRCGIGLAWLQCSGGVGSGSGGGSGGGGGGGGGGRGGVSGAGGVCVCLPVRLLAL